MNVKKFINNQDGEIQLTQNFKVKEFFCSCGKCTETLINIDHVSKLQKLRDDLGSTIHINSAYRCPEHNTAIGGEKNSMHMKGHATDIVIKDMTPNAVADACEKFDGLGRYDTFTHIDSREVGKNARWDKRTSGSSPKKPSKTDINVSLKDIDS